MALIRVFKLGLCAALCMTAIACSGGGGGGGGGSSGGSSGGGSSSSSSGGGPTGNVASVIVDQGPNNASVNTLFASVTVCAPGSTATCQTIDHIQVDTGSYGLRLLAPVLTAAMRSALPVETLASGKTVAECTQFVDGFAWGPIVTADVQIAGETAKSVPVQSIGDPRYSSVPTDCSSTGNGSSEDTVASFGANGILGVGPFEIDQPACANSAIAACYYACATATSCTSSAVPTAMLVPNPVTRFATDNNGVIVDLPSATAPALTLSGSLIFGIDTQANNASGTQTVMTVDQNANLLITYNGQSLANSFIDSGSNGIYFNDSSISKCTTTLTDFYCPSNALSLGLSIQGLNGVMANNLTFGVANAQTMLNANPTFNVFPQLAGTNPNQGSFDYGLAFFYGKRVAIAVEDKVTTAGTGPYIAF